MDNIVITGDLNAKHTDFNCTKADRWGMALKKALYNTDLFIADNSISTHRDNRTNSSDIIDYIISSPAIFNKIQNLTLNNNLSSDHSAILFDFLTNFNKCILPPIKVKLFRKADWELINSPVSNQRTDTILNIYNTLPQKAIKPNTSIRFAIQLLVKQKRKIKRAFIKTRNPFLRTGLNPICQKRLKPSDYRHSKQN